MIGYGLRTLRGFASHVWPLLALAFILTPAASTAGTDDESWSPPALTGEAGDHPEGRVVVQRVIDFMESHHQLAFEAVSTYETVQENGQKLEFTMLQRVAVQRPDWVFWVTLFDNAKTDTAWCKDGTFTAIKQPANVWASVKVPPTLSAAISRIADEYEVVVPFVDLLSGRARELWLGETVEYVDYIGDAWVEGYWTDHIAVRKPGIDMQLWFRQGDEPFPVKMSIIRTEEDGMPGYSARFHEWSTQVPKGSIPKFAPPKGAEKLEISPIVKR